MRFQDRSASFSALYAVSTKTQNSTIYDTCQLYTCLEPFFIISNGARRILVELLEIFLFVPAKCVDLRKDCRSYLSYCTLFPKYMKKYCPKSCEYCSKYFHFVGPIVNVFMCHENC